MGDDRLQRPLRHNWSWLKPCSMVQLACLSSGPWGGTLLGAYASHLCHPCNGPGNLPTVSRAGFLQVRKVMTVWEQLGLLCCPAHLWLTISAVAGQGIGSHSPLRYLREAACERKGTVLALGTLSLKSNLSLFVAVSSWLRYLTSLNLVFLMCNIGLKNLSALQGCLHRFRHVCK